MMIYQNILGLDIQVQYPYIMQLLYALGQLQGCCECLVLREALTWSPEQTAE